MSKARARGKRYETTLRVRSIANLATLAPRKHERISPRAPAELHPAAPALVPAMDIEHREGGKRPWIILSS